MGAEGEEGDPSSFRWLSELKGKSQPVWLAKQQWRGPSSFWLLCLCHPKSNSDKLSHIVSCKVCFAAWFFNNFPRIPWFTNSVVQCTELITKGRAKIKNLISGLHAWTWFNWPKTFYFSLNELNSLWFSPKLQVESTKFHFDPCRVIL